MRVERSLSTRNINVYTRCPIATPSVVAQIDCNKYNDWAYLTCVRWFRQVHLNGSCFSDIQTRTFARFCQRKGFNQAIDAFVLWNFLKLSTLTFSIGFYAVNLNGWFCQSWFKNSVFSGNLWNSIKNTLFQVNSLIMLFSTNMNDVYLQLDLNSTTNPLWTINFLW